MTPTSNVPTHRAAASNARARLALPMLAIASLALAACGSDSSSPAPSLTSVAPQSHAPTSTNGSQVAPSSSSGSSSSTGSSNSSGASSSSSASRRPGVPTIAYPGAGGPAPAGASAATSEFYVTKSGNTHCNFFAASSFGPDGVACHSEGLTQGAHQNDTPLGGISTASVKANGETEAWPQSEAPPYMQKNATETTLEYDMPITKGTFVCAGNSDGTTCWETKSGHGFFISKTELQRF